MKEKRPYETLGVRVVEFHRVDDVITSSIIDNDGDFRDWESEGDTW